MIEHPRKHGPFDPRFGRRPARTTAGEAESSQRRGAALSAALKIWEDEGGAVELLETRHAIEKHAPRAARALSASARGARQHPTRSAGLA